MKQGILITGRYLYNSLNKFIRRIKVYMKAKRDLLLVLSAVILTIALSVIPEIVTENWESPLWLIIIAIVMYIVFFILIVIIIRRIFKEVNKIDKSEDSTRKSENKERDDNIANAINKAIEKQTQTLADFINLIAEKNKDIPKDSNNTTKKE